MAKTIEQVDRMLNVLTTALNETHSRSRRKYLLSRIDRYLDERSKLSAKEVVKR